MRLTTGSQLGVYEIIGFIGAGGMGEVYRARDGRLHREVALKVVRKDFSADEDSLARLQQEARLAGSLNHPNVVAIYDVGLHEGIFYVVSELLEGENLRERLSAGPVPLTTALDWAAQVARGLGAAHERGVVHRDLKPENVFLTRSGHLKLLDFGIAKPVVEESPGERGLLEPTVGANGAATATGALLGTPGYMSPEQVRGEPLDPRSDVFSLGAILYELLSAQRAFPGSFLESGYAVLHKDPPSLPSSVPFPVARLVRRCLEKAPEQRFRSALDLSFALDTFRTPLASPGVAPPPEAGRPVRHRMLSCVAAAAVASVALAAVGAHGITVDGPRAPAAVRQLTFDRASVLAARFAPDGRSVLFSRSTGDGPSEIATTTVAHPRARAIGVSDAQLLAVSRTGEMAVATHPTFAWFDAGRGTLARAPVIGGAPREIALDVEYADWMPDGEQLVAARYHEERSSLEFPIGHVVFESSGFISHPRVSPSGDRVAFIDHPLSLDSAGMVMVVDQAGKVEQWSPRVAAALGLAWWPDGKSVLVTASEGSEPAALWSVSRKGTKVLYRGTGELLLDDVAPDGRVLLTQRDWRQQIEVRHGNEPQQTLDHLEWPVVSGVSDDGKSILWSESGLGVENKEEGFLRKEGQAAPIELGPGRPLALSPDGRQALIWRTDPPGSLWLVPTGPGEARRIRVPGLIQIDNAAVFADGRRLALVGRPDPVSPNRLYVFDTEHGTMRSLSPFGLPRYYFGLSISPDQAWISSPDSEGTLTIYPVEGGEPVHLPPAGPKRVPAGWLADGRLLTYTRFEVPSLVESFDPRTGALSPFALVAPNDLAGVVRITRVDVTPDGQTVVLNHRRMSGVLLLLDWGGKPPSAGGEELIVAGP